jgi:serine/threonine-protein kinase RsbW
MIFRLTLASNAGQIRRVESFLKKIRRSVHLDEIQRHKLMVSLTEAVNNAIIHGNKFDPEKKVNVTCEVMPGWLVLLVNDHGHGFQPDKVTNPLKKKNLLRTSGRGIFLMRTLMDKVIFESHRTGTQVQLWLDLNK